MLDRSYQLSSEQMPLSTEQCKKFMEQLCKNKVTSTEQKLGVRNLTMAWLMVDSNLRISEVVLLLVSDLFVQGKPVGTLQLVRGLKPNWYDVTFRLNERVRYFIGLMNEYWWTPDADKPGYFAFYNQSPQKHITQRQFQRIIKQAGFEALGCLISPNTLRQI